MSGVTAIAAGSSHSLALRRDGSVVAWGCTGEDNRGQCTVPPEAASGVTAIAAGLWQSLALKNGGVIAWGCGINFGQCNVPADATSGVTAIAAGWHSLALKDGKVLAWGCDIGDYGQCAVPAAAQSGVTAIAAGSSHSLALKQDGNVVAWGCRPPNDYGQCNVPAAASSGVIAIAAADFHNLALRQDGSVVAWGCRSNGNFTPNFGQCDVPGAASSGVAAIAVSYSNSLGLKQDGSVIAWGCDIGLDVGNCKVPAAAADGVGAIAAGDRQSLALFPLLAQTITVTVHAPTAATYKQSFTVAATSSSGLAVAFTSSGACSNSGATFTMTTGTGACLVKYDQPGEGAYNAAPQVVESVAAQKASQTIDFGPLPSKTYADPDFSVTARASSGLPVAFAARGKCRVRGSKVHLTGPGSCTVTASQAGDANYDPAPPVSRKFRIARTPCTVPNVVGKQLAPAKRVIKRHHCRTGKVRSADSRRSRGVVVSQSRRPGRVLPADSKIDLVVSRGPRR
jgi:hypothetical protein